VGKKQVDRHEATPAWESCPLSPFTTQIRVDISALSALGEVKELTY
jgi:hypothetical protein